MSMSRAEELTAMAEFERTRGVTRIEPSEIVIHNNNTNNARFVQQSARARKGSAGRYKIKTKNPRATDAATESPQPAAE